MQQVGGLEEDKLITPTVGWARSDKQLMFTIDRGVSWKDIAPNLEEQEFRITNVLFNDPNQGWILRQKTIGNGDAWSLLLSATQDQGRTWKERKPVGIPARDLEFYRGNASISFATPQQGWLELQTITSSNLSSGTLYMTTDGGASWQVLPRTPIFGTIRSAWKEHPRPSSTASSRARFALRISLSRRFPTPRCRRASETGCPPGIRTPIC